MGPQAVGWGEIVVETIAEVTTETGLTVEAVLDPGFEAVFLTRDQFHGEWTEPETVHESVFPKDRPSWSHIKV